jgi:hypothetical protein
MALVALTLHPAVRARALELLLADDTAIAAGMRDVAAHPEMLLEATQEADASKPAAPGKDIHSAVSSSASSLTPRRGCSMTLFATVRYFL